MNTARWIVWKAWNRTRYYWPQAQTRRDSLARIRAQVGEAEWDEHRKCYPRRPWWLP